MPLRIIAPRLAGLLLALSLTACDRPAPAPAPAKPRAAVAPLDKRPPSADLLSARKALGTKIRPTDFKGAGPADPPPADTFKLVHYPSPAGDLAAYLTPDPGDGKRRPAVVWAHGGFGGIGSYLWEDAPADNDQSTNALRAAGLVVLCPSWRAENDNPGRFESFYGEVDDALAAVAYLRAQPHVDPARVYFAGHSTGGTIALLAAEADGARHIRCAFSFGGAPEMVTMVVDGGEYGPTPYDPKSQAEKVLRSPMAFVAALKTPTWYFEGADSYYPPAAAQMQQIAAGAGAPFHAFTVENGTHFTILRPLTALVARKIVADTGPACNVTFTADELAKAFASRK